MNILILGADGYLGWPTALYFQKKGHNIVCLDNYLKRDIEQGISVRPLVSRPFLHLRCEEYKIPSCQAGITTTNGYQAIVSLLQKHEIDTIVHYAEQPSAPYSMRSRLCAINTQMNNIQGTLNVMFAVKHVNPDIHIIKLGTMGEYGTPNIDIEEGYLDVTHNGRTDRVLFPKQAGSFYHLSKVHDSSNLEFGARVWGLRVTDLNQGVVYGTSTDEAEHTTRSGTSFHYDETFGTVLNRFIVQSLLGLPITVYGNGTQRRGFLNLRDTLQCVGIAAEVRADRGEFKVRNQYTQVLSVGGLADRVVKAIGGTIERVRNPRVEAEDHYYNPTNDSFIGDGLCPVFLTAGVIQKIADDITPYLDNVDQSTIAPQTLWNL